MPTEKFLQKFHENGRTSKNWKRFPTSETMERQEVKNEPAEHGVEAGREEHCGETGVQVAATKRECK